MKTSEYLNRHLAATKESPDLLAARAGVARASVFRAKRDDDIRLSTMRQIVTAVGEPFVIAPETSTQQAPPCSQ